MTIKNRLAVELPGLNMKNPIMNSSGAVYFGLDESYDIEKAGALVTKTVTLAERSGNPQPWTVELPGGLLNSVGLANPGIHNVLKKFLPAIKAKYGDELPVMVSIAGETVDEYVTLTQLLTDTQYLTAIEVNLSCPNVDRGGMAFGVSAESASEVIAAVRQVTNLPIYAKLSPNVTDIKPIAKAVEAAGANGIVLINTVIGMSLDLHKRQPKLARGTGGLSGKAIHPIAVRLVYEAAQTVSIPIIGVGGIETVADALELMMAGASAVQVGAALTYNTHVMSNIIEAIPGALDNYHFDTIQELTRTFK
ncbi:dihydroorotate dehydrogenase [Leuconostoc rapi]|uniref:dihydroorotate dehydrogenase n=1 Tax=Leuconostoc rapi TaxID=1406906 RepID=UPI00195EB4D1|nr:dihydroorotate dehydrogenase [Leuconostoc rapi]MBM7434979.1 dihydroorotate dehydrogenase (NAD+) catalytic subunit [Leuconostoc rapi]